MAVNSTTPSGYACRPSVIIEGLKEGVGLKYRVADSALYTAETLQQLGGFGWISRVPETLTLAREMTLAVASDLACNPEPLSYRAICVTYAGIRQRWLIVHTHAARQRAEKTLRKQHLTLSEAESKAFKSLQGQTFACEADATAALQAFCQTLKLTEVHEPQIIASPRRKRGRPGTNQTPATYDYLIQVIHGPSVGVVQEVANLFGKQWWRALGGVQFDAFQKQQFFSWNGVLPE